jgi:sulfite exporter TauE/SafE
LTAFLVLGFLLGVRHALDADHVAAVASLATRSSSIRNTMRVAAAWGVGHTASLMVLGALLLALDASVSPAVGRWLEGCVGVMLVVLGVGVLRRVRRRRIHVHVHEHGAGPRHLHFHAHAPHEVHDRASHRHDHMRGLLPRALVVGGIHGIAGTAGFTLLSLRALGSIGWALFYLGLFGVGTILGMTLFSIVVSMPLRFSAERLRWASGGLEAALGSATILLGCWISAQSLLLGTPAP